MRKAMPVVLLLLLVVVAPATGIAFEPGKDDTVVRSWFWPIAVLETSSDRNVTNTTSFAVYLPTEAGRVTMRVNVEAGENSTAAMVGWRGWVCREWYNATLDQTTIDCHQLKDAP